MYMWCKRHMWLLSVTSTVISYKEAIIEQVNKASILNFVTFNNFVIKIHLTVCPEDSSNVMVGLV